MALSRWPGACLWLALALGACLLWAVDAQTAPSPPTPPVGTTTVVGAMASASPTCASADGTTAVAVTATGAPSGALTCRFVAHALATAMEDAEAAEAAAEVTYDEKVAVGESEKAQLGYTPNAALAAIASALEALTEARYVTGNATADALTAVAMATPVDPSEPLALSTDGDGVTTVAATCVVPAGDGGALTVALVDDGGAEGVDQYGVHYPLTDSRATKLSSQAYVRRTALRSVAPRAGPAQGSTVSTFFGEGFEAPMTCAFARDSEPTVVDANVLNASAATCVSPSGSGEVSVTLAFADGCVLESTFLYYDTPRVLAVRPASGPRFGETQILAFATNLNVLSSADADVVSPSCALGGDADVAVDEYGDALAEEDAVTSNVTTILTLGVDGFEPLAILPGELGADGASVTCPTSADGEVAAGAHAVRVSLNGQQFADPSAVAVSAGTHAFTAEGPFVAMATREARAGEGDGVIVITVNLVGECVAPVSVNVRASDGGSDAVSVSVATSTDADGNAVESFAVASSLANATRNGTHASDVDVVVATGIVLEWPADPTDARADRARSVSVTILDDAAREAALEALTLTLVNATNADVDPDASLTVIVVQDDDPLPQLAVRPFYVAYPPVDADTGATLYETNTVSVPVDVVSGESALAYSAAYVVANGTAVSGVAYTNASGTLHWDAHDAATKYVDVDVHWAAIPPEAELTVGVTLTPLENAALDATDLTGLTVWKRSMAATQALHLFGVPPGACPPGTRRTTSEGWVGAPPPPSPPPPASPMPPSPPPPGSRDDAELYSLAVVSQPASAIDADTGEVYVPDPVTATLEPAFSPGGRSYQTTLANAYARTTVRYRTRSRDAVVLGVDTTWTAEEAPVAVDAFARGAHPTYLENGDFEAAVAFWDEYLDDVPEGGGERKRRRELLQVLGDVTDLEVDLAVGATVVRWNISAASAEEGEVTTAYALTIRRLTGASAARLAGVTIRATSPSGSDDEADAVITAGLVMVGNADENGGFDAAHTTYELDQVLPYDAASFTAEVAFQAASEVLLATMRVTSSASDAFETIRTLAHFSNDANGQTESVPLTAHLPDHDLVAIRVLTKDGRTTRTYTVRVARAAPPGPPPPPAAPPPPAPPSPPPVDLFPEIAPLSPADSPECTHCAPGTFSAARDVLACAPCAPGSAAAAPRATRCGACAAGFFARRAGAVACSACPLGTFAASAGSVTCALCAEGTTSAGFGAAACDVADEATDEAHEDVFFVNARFGVRFSGSGAAFPDGVLNAVGVDAAPETAFALVLRSDVASGFDVTLSRVFPENMTVPSLGIVATASFSRESAERAPQSARASSRKMLATMSLRGASPPEGGVGVGEHLASRRLLQEEDASEEDSATVTPACASTPSCVADVDVRVIMQATDVLAEGLITTYERREEAMRIRRVAAAEAAANLTADPSAFFARTVTALGGAAFVTASLTSPVVLSEKAPEPEPAFRDAFAGLPEWVDPWVLVGMAAGSILAWTAAPRLARCLSERYGAYQVEAALARSVRRASVASGKETSAPEMRPMTREALARLARFKKQRAKTHLDRMWDRRASAAPGVAAEADQFG